MWKRIALFIAAAVAFGIGPLADRLMGPVLGACLLVVLGVLLALAASGTISAISAASGAVGAFASGVLATTSPIAAGAVLVALAYAERTIRVRNASARAVHVGIALVAGALAGAITERYLGAGITVRMVVVVVAAVLASLPLLVEADDPLAHTLDAIADDVSEPAKATLREGAELCRTVDATMLDRPTAAQASKTWLALLRLAQARARLERTAARKAIADTPDAQPEPDAQPKPDAEPTEKPASSGHGAALVRRLDKGIAEHVSALARIYTAADEVRAAELSIDDRALRSAESSGESLAQMSKAIVEEV